MLRVKGARVTRTISGERVLAPPSGKAPERRRLEGALVLLEPLDPSRHSKPLYVASHETEEARRIWTYLPDGPFPDFASFDQWARRIAVAPDRLFFAFRDKHTDQLGGMATYLDIRPEMGSIEVGYIWFAPSLQRTRQATEALFLMLSYPFDELKYRRMQWRCNALNEKSRAAALRLGFTFEGIFYQHMVVKGCNRDTAWYSLMDHEWPRIRRNFERWLAPSNFDAEGRQVSSLKALNAEAAQQALAADAPQAVRR
ncbi:MAG TPA: GNAT family protein [Myxococcaceae bacterium]|nr:GNAT family protein [Myxococcaceae bacterium]